MIDPTLPLPVSEPPIVSETEKQLKNNSRRGFASHPENINTNGRPKKEWTWAQLLEEAAEELIETKNKSGEVTGRKALKQLVARKLLTQAAGGNVQASNLIMSRMDGMPLQATDITSMGEKLIMPHVTVDTKPEESNG